MATFEAFFTNFLAEQIGQSVNITIAPDSVASRIDDRQRLSQWHAEATFYIDCYFSSKAQADTLLEDIDRKIDLLPWLKPLVMSASMIAQNVTVEGKPKMWRYTGAFRVRYHVENTY